MHGRLPWYIPAELSDTQRVAYEAITGGPRAAGPSRFRLTDDSGRLEGPFNAMLASPGVGVALQELGAAVRYRTALSDRCREIAILTLARLRGCDFEWYAHERVGRAAGLTEDELSALRDGRRGDSLSTAESTVHDVVTALVRDRDLDDAAFTAARATLGLEQLAELITLVGYYDLLALSLRAWRTPLPAGEEPIF